MGDRWKDQSAMAQKNSEFFGPHSLWLQQRCWKLVMSTGKKKEVGE